jgi:hypothetical protein
MLTPVTARFWAFVAGAPVDTILAAEFCSYARDADVMLVQQGRSAGGLLITASSR